MLKEQGPHADFSGSVRRLSHSFICILHFILCCTGCVRGAQWLAVRGIMRCLSLFCQQMFGRSHIHQCKKRALLFLSKGQVWTYTDSPGSSHRYCWGGKHSHPQLKEVLFLDSDLHAITLSREITKSYYKPPHPMVNFFTLKFKSLAVSVNLVKLRVWINASRKSLQGIQILKTWFIPMGHLREFRALCKTYIKWGRWSGNDLYILELNSGFYIKCTTNDK